MTSTRATIRAALMEIQAGTCALCPSAGPLVVDHDHVTGMARGLLCRPCNTREGKTRSPGVAMLAYRDNPPAAGREWMWDWPDREPYVPLHWCQDEEIAMCREEDCCGCPGWGRSRGFHCPAPCEMTPECRIRPQR